MKTIIQILIRSSVWFWAIVFAIFAGAAWLRIHSIDRGTPTLGVAVYLMMLMTFFVVLALPAGMVSGALARRFLRWSIDPLRLRIMTALVVALLVFALHHLGRSGPPWHVWSSTAAITALLTLRSFRWGRRLAIAWHADHAGTRAAERQRALAFDPRNF